ncbi:MAG TPA: hypothetical protein VJZ72_04425, partial [Candidatus Limnocylindrales bacterium]|nr:hypothetical protein [Candidatus Limnocylindrales bacterium]
SGSGSCAVRAAAGVRRRRWHRSSPRSGSRLDERDIGIEAHLTGRQDNPTPEINAIATAVLTVTLSLLFVVALILRRQARLASAMARAAATAEGGTR